MKVKPKKCLQCNIEFTQQRIGQKCCGIKCSIDYAKIITEEDKDFNQKVLKEAKEKPLSYYLNALQKDVNTLARMIDYGQKCISSNRVAKSEHGGHLWSVGSMPSLRFNLNNIHLQSGEQNVEKSGNPLGYRIGLKERYGDEYLAYVDSLPLLYPKLKPTKEELIEAIKVARRLIRDFDLKPLLAEERLQKRKEFNLLIGFYKTQAQLSVYH